MPKSQQHSHLLSLLAFIGCLLYSAGLRGDEEVSRSWLSAERLAEIQRALGLPDAVGTVIDAYWPRTQPSGLPEFILIQDIHKHPEVQRHIATMLLQGYHQ